MSFSSTPMQLVAPMSPPPSDIGSRLGRLSFTPPPGMRYLDTSAAAGWRGAFLTHVEAEAGPFQGCWSWIRVTCAPTPDASATIRERRCSQGGVLVGHPGQDYSATLGAPSRSLNLFIDPVYARGLLQAELSESALIDAARDQADGVVEHLIRALAGDVGRGSPGGPLLGESVVTAILHRLQGVRPAPPAAPGPRLSAAEGDRLRAYIVANLRSSIHLDDLADELDMSVRHLCRMLRNTLGVTPHQYVTQLRIEAARALLVSERLSIEEIAERAGFSDRNHMATTFRRVLDATPLQIRKGG